MNILMVASEAAPFAKTGGLADVMGALPPALAARGENVAVVMPAYRENTYPGPLREAYARMRIPIDRGYEAQILHTEDRDVTFYFVNCPALFDREGFYGHVDDPVRFGVLSMAAIDVARHLFRPQVIHCHDWQASLVPIYLREHFRGDPNFLGVKTLLTIHNLGYQGLCGPEFLPRLGLDARLFNPEQLEFFGNLNLLKGGIVWSDAVSTVSKGYAREIQTREYGFGLEGLLERRAPIHGIVNGVDYAEWDPARDPNIARNYSVEDLSGKRECKKELLEGFSLSDSSPRRPVIGIVSRFVSQKGFGLLSEVGSRLLQDDVSMTVLGSGDPSYESMFRALARAFPDRVGLKIGYDNGLAHRIEAGADLFLMPSQYEPCGLSQIYSLKYGTVPVVRATGGLDDTIDEDTGFKFREYSGEALLEATELALSTYRYPEVWTGMMRRGMRKDYSWDHSSAEYVALYRQLGRPESFRELLHL
jgi:starch synthase